MHATETRALEILFYVPNLIGYARIALLVAAGSFSGYSEILFLIFYGLSAILDGFDGYAARRLKQTSAFGAWLDVVVDNFGRSMCWNRINSWTWIIASWEWFVFVCTHRLGPAWKSGDGLKMPNYVESTMKKGFKSPLGIWAISGLHVLPIWLLAQRIPLVTSTVLSGMVSCVLISGRLWCFLVEVWFVLQHIKDILHYDMPAAEPSETQSN